jgi:hypothetical protein
MIARAHDVDAAVARAVLLRSFPESVRAEPRRTAWTLEFVAHRIEGTSTVMRFGVRATALAVGLLLRLRHRSDLRRDEPGTVQTLQRWMDLPLPVLAEYVRLVRSLTLVGWFDAPEAVR